MVDSTVPSLRIIRTALSFFAEIAIVNGGMPGPPGPAGTGTVTVAYALALFAVAPIVALPGAAAVSSPDDETGIAVWFELTHEIAAPGTALKLASVAVARSCRVLPCVMVAAGGATNTKATTPGIVVVLISTGVTTEDEAMEMMSVLGPTSLPRCQCISAFPISSVITGSSVTHPPPVVLNESWVFGTGRPEASVIWIVMGVAITVPAV
jgi:hypothetical protein